MEKILMKEIKNLPRKMILDHFSISFLKLNFILRKYFCWYDLICILVIPALTVNKQQKTSITQSA